MKMSITTLKQPRVVHYPTNSPFQLRKAAGIMHAYINNQFTKGLMSGGEAEQLSLAVTRIMTDIAWPNCRCEICQDDLWKK